MAIDAIHESQRLGSKLIAGFDMVNEEDVTPPIKDFIKQIVTSQDKQDFPVILHGKFPNQFTNNYFSW